MSTCFLCNRPGHFWRNSWRSKYPTASARSNNQCNLPTCRLQAKEPLSEISGTDNIFGIQEEPEPYLTHSLRASWSKFDLLNSGWRCNEKKSNWEPRQLGEWLGVIIDTARMLFVVPEKKIVKLKSILTELIHDFPNLKVRRVASLSGFVISLSVALGPVARLFIRQMYFFIILRQSWNDVLVANEGVLQEFKFWLAHVVAFNGYPINRPLSSSAVLTCDASETGYGAHIVFYNERKFCSRMWNELQKCMSSSYLGLMALLLESFIAGKKITVFSDNQNVVRIVHNGSSVGHLQRIAVDIFSFCTSNNVSFQAQWIPRAENQLADYLSRIVDPDDWSLSPRLFHLIVDKWGPFHVDRMASHHNSRLPRFYSKFWCPGSEAVDCFTQDWGKGCNNYVCPPTCLVTAVLFHMQFCKANGTLIVPEWKTAPFWPLLHNPARPGMFPDFVKDYFYLPKSRDMFCSGY